MKQKVWHLTVKDNPNGVVVGENDEFYTTDTEAYLVFILRDENFSPEKALLTLENRNDGSLKSEEVEVVDGAIKWEMSERYIEHSGNWQGQLVYEQLKGGVPEKYTSGVVAFTVNSHIKDKKKPSLVEIEDWEKFIREGTELIETWEDLEALREENELQRQANYQELLDTGVLQTNINTKLEALEEEYAPKLTEVTAQLAQTESSKVDKSGSGQVKWANIAQDAREQISGDKVAVVDDNSIITTNLTDNAIKTSKIGKSEVTAETTDFVNVSTNLLDEEKLIEGKVILSDGTISENNYYYYSHRIDVLPGQTLFTRHITNLAWYDQNDNFISRSTVNAGEVSSKFTEVPNDTYYVRVNVTRPNYSLYDLQISVSDVEIPYEPYYQELRNVEVSATDIVGQFSSSHIENDSISEQKVSFIKKSSNLLNRENVKKGSILIDGTISVQADYFHSHRIDVLPNQTLFTRNITNLAFFDQDDDFLIRLAVPAENVTNALSLVPNNAYYVRGNIHKIRYDKPLSYPLQISISDVEIPYEPYHISMDNFQYPAPSLLTFKTDDRYIVNGKTDGVYQNSLQLAGYENVETDWLPDKIYQKFDELMSDYPKYITKQTMGKDSSGLFDINMYRFKPQNVPTLNQVKRPKMILMAGNHGYEKTHPYVLYLVMKKLCEEWRTDELLETLRWNVDFIIIPCSNPSSFKNGSRTNSNGVDISRNFEAGWELSEDVNKGNAPLSEPESQYIDDILKEHHEDAIFFTSLHNFSSSTDPEATSNKPNEFIWVPAADKLQEHISQELVSRMTRLWKRKYEWIPQDEDLYLGYVDRQTPYGLEGLQANLYGITASTYEISRIFQLEDNPVNSNGQVITMGVEGLVNLLLLNLKVGTEYYNQTKKVVKK